jgi:hypothetical protein
MSMGFGITFIGLLTRRYIEQTPFTTVRPTLSQAKNTYVLGNENYECVFRKKGKMSSSYNNI